ncbi:hypothetical protein SAMN04487783_0482 [Agrococcus baldri]|uniref:Uncharacterized protein n=1 Tax=Agrococcus baldri TaxID=153730 RepID=A0AA94HKX5_9MICO|nr:hypothetical protein [Agrococcus baldri]SFS00754.1 hypothetical protein SAMN04487783_0482 [Agrococcus baldri]
MTVRGRLLGTGVAGVLTANALPHLATAAAGRTMMTPLGGKGSGTGPNLLWGCMNLAAGIALAGRSGRRDRDWSRHVTALTVGAAVFLSWAAVAEGVLHLNAPEKRRASRRR